MKSAAGLTTEDAGHGTQAQPSETSDRVQWPSTSYMRFEVFGSGRTGVASFETLRTRLHLEYPAHRVKGELNTPSHGSKIAFSVDALWIQIRGLVLGSYNKVVYGSS